VQQVGKTKFETHSWGTNCVNSCIVNQQSKVTHHWHSSAECTQ